MSKSKTLAPSVTHSDPKGRKFISIVEAAYDKAALSEEEGQRVNDARGLGDLIRKFVEENRSANRYADQQVASSYDYPEAYKKLGGPKPMEKQAEIFVACFPGIDPEPALRYTHDVYPKLQVPDWVEGPFGVLSISALSRLFFPEITDLRERNCRAVELILAKLGETREDGFYNYREGQLTPDRFGLVSRTAEALAVLEQEQEGSDILVISGQFGIRHRGKSVLRASETFVQKEFGAHTVGAGSMLLTHPEREVRWEQLHCDVPGDELRPDDGVDVPRAPCFFLSVGELEFNASQVGSPLAHFGSVSFFLGSVIS